MLKICQKGRVFWRRPPRSWKVLMVFMVYCLLNSLELANGISCDYDEAPQCSNNNSSDCSCIKCLVCPPGQGLHPQCGSEELNNNTTMKCLPCQKGTYSEQNDFGSCHSCRLCVGQHTLRKCTATHNAICKKGSCMNGYQWDEYMEACEKVPITPSKEKKTSPQPTTRPSTHVQPTLASSNASSNEDSGSNEPVTKSTPIIGTSLGTPQPTAEHKNNWIRITSFILGPLLALALLVIGFKKRQKIISFFCHLYCSCKGLSPMDQQDQGETSPMQPQGQELEEIIVVPSDGQRRDIGPDQSNANLPLQQGESLGQGSSRPDEQDPQNVHHAAISSPTEQQGEGLEKVTDIPDLCGQLLKDLSLGLKNKISFKISNKDLKGWREIGGFLKVDNDKLEQIQITCSYGENKLPGKHLLESLEAEMPHLTVEYFLEALKSIDRNDLIYCIRTECFK